MRILADAPGAFPWLGPTVGPVASVDAPASPLWRALAADATPWAHAWADPLGFWRGGYAVAEAPGSQYDVLRELGAQGALPPGPLFCLAGDGRGFHGREGRAWVTVPGNLHLCAVLPVDLPAASCAPVLPALPALACLAAVRQVVPARSAAGIKWINDVVVDGAKVGGVLTALRTRAGRIETVFLGIGLNVATTPASAAATGTLPAADLSAAARRAVGLGEVVPLVLAALAERTQELTTAGPAALLADYRAASAVMGRRVTVQPEEGPCVSGRVTGIGDDLALLLEAGPPVRGGRLLSLDD
jgi:BirA family biotin operon repressor/biotin-[acetyl-CoA-carboxylase] ligase